MQDDKAMECCMMAGRIMIKSGAETYRVQDTMDRMAAAMELPDSESFVTPTAIIFSPGNRLHTRIATITARTTDLEKIALVNEVSRSLANKLITSEEAFVRLQHIETEHRMFPFWQRWLAASVASGSFIVLLEAPWFDIPVAFAAGGVGFLIAEWIEMGTRVRFFAEFSAALVIGLLGFLSVALGVADQVDTVIIGSVMPLVPGLLITNAVRDLMAGHFVAGVSKGTEAFLTASAIGAGVAASLSMLGGFQ